MSDDCKRAGLEASEIEANLNLAHELLSRMRSGASAETVAELASEELIFEVPGAVGVLPWTGEVKHGRQALADFVREQRARIQTESFQVDDILVSRDRAAIIGRLNGTFVATNKVIQSAFAIVLTIVEHKIIGFYLMEDSYAVFLATQSGPG
jgi:uncharacterized protein